MDLITYVGSDYSHSYSCFEAMIISAQKIDPFYLKFFLLLC